ncbi:MAG: hypothetical protein RCG16_06975 [Rickettsia hoogstraalii]
MIASSITFKLNIAEINNTTNILSQTSIKNFRQTTLGLDVETIDKKFLSIPTFNVAMEIMTYLFKHLDSEKTIVSSNQTIQIKYSLMKRLLFKYPSESAKHPKLLKNYEAIQKLGNFKDEPLEWTEPDTLTKIQVMSLAFQCSILNRSDKVTADIFKYIITATNLYFNHFTKEVEQYSKCAEYILPILKLIEPESQLKIIQALVPYIKFSLDLSGQFSNLLIENKNFEEAKALLEESIFSLNTNTENQVLAQWYYRTGRTL